MFNFADIQVGDRVRKNRPQAGPSSSANWRKEESPDSIERRTGEEPGLVSAGTESATENDRPASVG